jgi:RimJ/RimL family protein N-acetyltransferase
LITIRPITVDDAAAFLDLRRHIDTETKFMLLEPDERTTTVEQVRERLAAWLATDNKMVFLAEDDGQSVGYLSANGGDYRRNHDTVHIVIGLRESHLGQGLGTRLFVECEKWAREQQLHRLELTVMTHNHRGLALYQKMDFEIEGTARHQLKVDGKYVDQYLMSKLLS